MRDKNVVSLSGQKMLESGAAIRFNRGVMLMLDPAKARQAAT
jgi:hypothetical protein